MFRGAAGLLGIKPTTFSSRAKAWVAFLTLPSTAGGKNWHPMSYHRPTRQVIIPLSQSCMSLRAQAIEQKPGGGSGGGAQGPEKQPFWEHSAA